MSLDQTTLQARSRVQGGKGPARRLRVEGLIPAVVYGRGSEPVTLAVDPVGLKKAIATPHRLNTVITVKVEGAGDRLVLLKDYQQHPVTRQLLHADFVEVRLDREVTVSVPVVLTGKPEGVVAGGLLSQVTRQLEITCLPRAIPVSLSVDVSALKIGQSLHSGDVTLAEGLKLTRKDLTIATVSVPEAAEAAAPAAAAAAPAAAAGGKAPATGAAPAAAAGGKAAPAAAAAKAPAKK